MHSSTIIPLLLAPLLAAASLDWTGPPGGAPTGGWGGDQSWAAASTEKTTTYVAETTITMTLLAVQTETQYYFSQNTTTTTEASSSSSSSSSSSYKLPSSSVEVFATPAASTPPAIATGAADLLNVNAVALMMGLGAAVVGTL